MFSEITLKKKYVISNACTMQTDIHTSHFKYYTINAVTIHHAFIYTMFQKNRLRIKKKKMSDELLQH